MAKFEEKEYNTSSFDLNLWKNIFLLMKDQFKELYKLAFYCVGISLCECAFPYFYKLAIDSFATNYANIDNLKYFVIIFIINIILSGLFCYLFLHQAGKIEMEYAYDIRKKCFDKLMNLSFSYYDVTPSGWIVARVSNDIARLAEIVSWSFLDVCYGVVKMVAIALVMLVINAKLAMIIIVIMPFILLTSIYFQNRILKHSREIRKINSKITNDYNEGITGAKTTKTLNLEHQNFEAFKADTLSMKESSIRSGIITSIYMPTIVAFSALCSALIMYYGGNAVIMKTIEFGTLVMFVQYITEFFDPIRQLARIISDLQMAQAAGERVLSLLDTDSDIADSEEVIAKYGDIMHPKKENYESIEGNVSFKHVKFYYNPNEIILDDFNLDVHNKQTIALVGETGSGKSTIINLLCRFYEPVEGSIEIDGVDYRKRSIGYLHDNIGYVLQAPHLFSGSIKDNILYGNTNATMEDVKEVCHMLNADSFIEKMENGYDSEVGEQGNLLSTGQKQLISFARALVRKPKIFVLDEATSSIDTQTEAIIQYAIDNIMKQHTCFIVAHRLSTIVNADRILVISKGKIIESGNHMQLMKLKGQYYRLYTNQFNEDIANKWDIAC